MTKIYLLLFCFISIVNAQSIVHDTIDLKESIVYNKQKYKLKKFGPDAKSKTVLIGLKADFNFKKDSLPKIVKCFAVQIKAPKKDYLIEQLNFNFDYTLSHEVKLKVDLIEDIKTDQMKSLLKAPIYLSITNATQDDENVFHYSLKDIGLKHKDEFYIYVELLEDLEKPVYFSGAFFSTSYYQSENQEKWTKVPL